MTRFLMYQMAFEDDTFETLVLKLLEKSFEMAIENNCIDKKLLYFKIELCPGQ